jgi:hypothetical protein
VVAVQCCSRRCDAVQAPVETASRNCQLLDWRSGRLWRRGIMWSDVTPALAGTPPGSVSCGKSSSSWSQAACNSDPVMQPHTTHLPGGH